MNRPAEAAAGAPLLETRSLTKDFGGVRAVNKVSIRVAPATLHVVIGPNGAGKTTLFHLLTGVVSPTSGEIFFDGEVVTGVSLSGRVKRGLARSYQKTNIFPRLTVRQNILAAAHRAKGTGWKSLLGATASTREAERLTDQILEDLGLQDQSEAEAQTLPYGSQRLIDIGIALTCEPKLLLLDEPTSGLSSGELDRIIEFIRDLRTRYSILLIEHNMDLVLAFADVITVLNFGEVIAEGKPAEIAKNALVQEAYFGQATTATSGAKA